MKNVNIKDHLYPQDNNTQVELSVFDRVEPSTGTSINCPLNAWGVVNDMSGYSQEAFVVLSLNTKNQLIKKTIISIGLVDSAPVHPREIFRAAIKNNAKSIILVHNHPSGDPSPSSQDLKITRRMIDSSRILQIPVRDHIIVGKNEKIEKAFCSMREQNLLSFD